MAVAGICAAVAAAGLVWGLNEVRGQIILPGDSMAGPKSEPGKNSPNITVGGNVTIGHIGDVNINQAPAPELKIVGERMVENKKYVTVAVVSPYAPGQLILSAEGDGVTGGDINPLDAGIIQFGHREEPNKVTFYIQSPTRRYDIGITSSKPTAPVNLRYEFK
jgi:hypothetical protein